MKSFKEVIAEAETKIQTIFYIEIRDNKMKKKSFKWNADKKTLPDTVKTIFSTNQVIVSSTLITAVIGTFEDTVIIIRR